MQTLDKYMDGLVGHPTASPVREPDKTAAAAQTTVSDADVDTLFGDSECYRDFKREKPEHRIMLWHRLRGRSVKEIATLMGYRPGAVYEVSKQEWFVRAFCRLSSEIGRDVVETFLEGEVVPTLQRLVQLRDSGETDAVKKAACDSILDRVRGRPMQKSDIKVTGQIDNVVYDAAKLLDEERRLTEALRSRGIGGTN